MSVSERFSTLLSWTNFTQAQAEQYASHIKTVKRRLETVFAGKKVSQIGSMSRGSASAYGSDADLLLVLSRDDMRWGSSWKTFAAH
ncbi:MAG: hypothetical protein Q7R35_10230 [Elusimicrobiota bacterium]|nr:hypothetical protein [Elusimicrobiota bacterium]